ncbi:hypothetical protein DFQ27_006441 [Actinomortierella ambigua]|uniref:Cyclin N-terminal domain-containing protein n=1 Tax=Actinomortierella ambigua TaxID=1343610 RepID=A0A9P6QH60_9FUNG|nr:hypothetical protein DFQ26_008921 [Actinomortierella ambigua]KAG0268525.1 hypothetical protein DFQ27_006441 [Actinomortierella ambigua]
MRFADKLLTDFLREIYTRAALTEIALVVSLIYVERLKKVLTNMARGEPDTPFRIFLSALLAATKFLHEDGSGLNRTFASITNGYYTLADINTMERSFLGLLQFGLLVTEQDLIDYIQLHEQELKGLDLLPMLRNANQHHH